MKHRLLLFSIHDVAPAFEPHIDRLLDLARPVVGERLAMLVVPNHWNSVPLASGTAFASRLRGWADRGIEMFLHGFTHRDDSRHASVATRLKASRMTAGEGEFLGLSRNEAGRRIAAGRARIEDIIGRPVAGFVAPAWLYGEGAMAAIAEAGFPLAEDHWSVWSPLTGERLLRGPVMTWASRTPFRMASSLAVAAAARRLPTPPVMRVAVHPGDTGQPAILSSVEKTLARLARTRRAGSYRELLGKP